LFAAGHMLCKALDAADLLRRQGIGASVVNVSTIKPLDAETVRRVAGGRALAVSIEEHSIIGGLGSAVAEVLAETAGMPRLLRLGVRDRFGESGMADELLEKYRLTGKAIAGDVAVALR